MKHRIVDFLGVLSVGLLLTIVFAVWGLVAQTFLEDSALFSTPTRWWNVYVFRNTILLGMCPILFALFSAERTAFSPFLSGIGTCLIPTLCYLALKYSIHVADKLQMERLPHLGWPLGYVDPANLWGNVVLAAGPVAWAVAVGTCGGTLAFICSRRRVRKESLNQ
jgi:hypothetical protein